MQSIIRVRSSNPSDQDAISSLVASARAESLLYRGTPPAIETTSHVLVAEVGDSIVGALGYEQSGQNARITWVHVFPDAREVGIGDALLEHVTKLLSQQQATWVTAYAQPGDRSVKNLFERHGLVAQQIVVGKSLSDPSTAERASQ